MLKAEIRKSGYQVAGNQIISTVRCPVEKSGIGVNLCHGYLRFNLLLS